MIFFLRSAAFRGHSQLTRGQPHGDSCSTKSSSRRQSWRARKGGTPPGGGRSVHAGAPVPTLYARARARNGKQNAPRTSSCSSRSRVVRFVSRFSRARGHVPTLSWAPWPRDRPKKCHFGGSGGGHFPSFGHFWGTIAGIARAVSIWSTFGRKIFLTEQQCRREDRAQKSIRVNFFLRSATFRGRSQLTRGQPSGGSCSTKSSSRRQV